jgi:Flp pilus assembly pilin Flp
MNKIFNRFFSLLNWRDGRGQDLIEYALMAGFVAVAAGAIMPAVVNQISVIFTAVSNALTASGS